MCINTCVDANIFMLLFENIVRCKYVCIFILSILLDGVDVVDVNIVVHSGGGWCSAPF